MMPNAPGLWWGRAWKVEGGEPWCWWVVWWDDECRRLWARTESEPARAGRAIGLVDWDRHISPLYLP